MIKTCLKHCIQNNEGKFAVTDLTSGGYLYLVSSAIHAEDFRSKEKAQQTIDFWNENPKYYGILKYVPVTLSWEE